MNKTRFLAAITLLAFAHAEAAPAHSDEGAVTPKAISFPFSYIGEIMGNPTGGERRGAVYTGLLSIGVAGDLGQLAGWEGASFLVSAVYPHGPSLTDRYVNAFNEISSIEAYNSIRLCEAWLQQEFADGKFSIRLGQILVDEEFFASENANLFINSVFGALPLVCQNFFVPVYPYATPGVRVRYTASESFSIQAGVFADGPAGDFTRNKHGFDWHLNRDGVLAIAEAAYTRNGSVYKLGCFYQSRETETRANAGGYIVIDQKLWCKPGTDEQGLNGFLRIGGASNNRNIVPFYCDAGFHYRGLIPCREKDCAGIGVSFTRLNKHQHDSPHRETIVEATYSMQIKEWIAVQPDIQYIRQPNALVVGIRVSLTFE